MYKRNVQILAMDGLRSEQGGNLRMAGLLVIGMLAWAGIMLLGTLAVISGVVPAI